MRDNEYHKQITRAVNDWVHRDGESHRFWLDRTQQDIDRAARAGEVRSGEWSTENMSLFLVTMRLKMSVEEGKPKPMDPLFEQFIAAAMREVHWMEIADALIEELCQEKNAKGEPLVSPNVVQPISQEGAE